MISTAEAVLIAVHGTVTLVVCMYIWRKYGN